jgi:hypothetical protein
MAMHLEQSCLGLAWYCLTNHGFGYPELDRITPVSALHRPPGPTVCRQMQTCRLALDSTNLFILSAGRFQAYTFLTVTRSLC